MASPQTVSTTPPSTGIVGSLPGSQMLEAEFLPLHRRFQRASSERIWREPQMSQLFENLILEGLALIARQSPEPGESKPNETLSAFYALCEEVVRERRGSAVFSLRSNPLCGRIVENLRTSTVTGRSLSHNIFDLPGVAEAAGAIATPLLQSDDPVVRGRAAQVLLLSRNPGFASRAVEILKGDWSAPDAAVVISAVRGCIRNQNTPDAVVSAFIDGFLPQLRPETAKVSIGMGFRVTRGILYHVSPVRYHELRKPDLMAGQELHLLIRDLVDRRWRDLPDLIERLLDAERTVPAAVYSGLLGIQFPCDLKRLRCLTEYATRDPLDSFFVARVSDDRKRDLSEAVRFLTGERGGHFREFSKSVLLDPTLLEHSRRYAIRMPVFERRHDFFVRYPRMRHWLALDCPENFRRIKEAPEVPREDRPDLLRAHVEFVAKTGQFRLNRFGRDGVHPRFLRWVVAGKRGGVDEPALARALYKVASVSGARGVEIVSTSFRGARIPAALGGGLARVALGVASGLGTKGEALVDALSTPRMMECLRAAPREFVQTATDAARCLAEVLPLTYRPTDILESLLFPIVSKPELTADERTAAVHSALTIALSKELPESVLGTLGRLCCISVAREAVAGAAKALSREQFRIVLATQLPPEQLSAGIAEVLRAGPGAAEAALLAESNQPLVSRLVSGRADHIRPLKRMIEWIALHAEEPERELQRFDSLLSAPGPNGTPRIVELRDPWSEFTVFRNFCEAYGKVDAPQLFESYRATKLFGAPSRSTNGRFDDALSTFVALEPGAVSDSTTVDELRAAVRIPLLDVRSRKQFDRRLSALKVRYGRGEEPVVSIPVPSVVEFTKIGSFQEELSQAERARVRELRRLFLDVYRFFDGDRLQRVHRAARLSERKDSHPQSPLAEETRVSNYWGRKLNPDGTRFNSSSHRSTSFWPASREVLSFDKENEFRQEIRDIEQSVPMVASSVTTRFRGTLSSNLRKARLPGELFQVLVHGNSIEDLRGKFAEPLIRSMIGAILLSGEADEIVRDLVRSEGDTEWHDNLKGFFDSVVFGVALQRLFPASRTVLIERAREALSVWSPGGETEDAPPTSNQHGERPNLSMEIFSSRGVIGEFSGFAARACWGRGVEPIFIGKPNLFYTGFRRENAHGVMRQFGGTMVVRAKESQTSEPVLVIRGFNPTLDILRAVAAGDLFEKTLDYLEPFARAEGVTAFAVPLEQLCGTTHTNRAGVHRYLTKQYFQGGGEPIRLEPSAELSFNAHDISERCVVVRRLR